MMGFGVRGASHSEVDRFQAAQLAERRRLRALLPEGTGCVYFPADPRPYQVWQDREGRAPVPISGEHSTPEGAMWEVIGRIANGEGRDRER